jgi:histidinol-phosphatase (PHP family)
MIVDYHTHTALCKHGTGSVREYVEQACRLGLDEIGCSEHIPMPDGFDLVHRMTVEEYYAAYKPAVSEAREEFRTKIAVKRGIEADFYAGTEPWVRSFIAENEFDYVIGSVHFLGEWGIDNPVFVHRYEERDIDRTFSEFFDTVRSSAASGLFDIIGHCDLVKKFGHRPTGDLRDRIRDMLETIKRMDLCLEINTSGLRKPVGEMYPSTAILAMARDLRIPLTLGSDAHQPAEVAADFAAAVELIERYGGGKIAIFDKRERRMVDVFRLG